MPILNYPDGTKTARILTTRLVVMASVGDDGLTDSRWWWYGQGAISIADTLEVGGQPSQLRGCFYFWVGVVVPARSDNSKVNAGGHLVSEG